MLVPCHRYYVYRVRTGTSKSSPGLPTTSKVMPALGLFRSGEQGWYDISAAWYWQWKILMVHGRSNFQVRDISKFAPKISLVTFIFMFTTFFHSFSIFFLSDRDNMRWSARQGGKKPNGWWLIAHFPPIEPQKRGIPHFWPKPYIYIYNFIYVNSNVVFFSVTIWSIFQTELVGWMFVFLSKHSWYSHQRSKVKNVHCITWLPEGKLDP